MVQLGLRNAFWAWFSYEMVSLGLRNAFWAWFSYEMVSFPRPERVSEPKLVSFPRPERVSEPKLVSFAPGPSAIAPTGSNWLWGGPEKVGRLGPVFWQNEAFRALASGLVNLEGKSDPQLAWL